jgi:hypothetical protein
VLGIFWCPLQETCCFVCTRDVLFSVTGYWRRIVNMCWRWFVFRYRRLTVLYWRCVVFFYLSSNGIQHITIRLAQTRQHVSAKGKQHVSGKGNQLVSGKGKQHKAGKGKQYIPSTITMHLQKWKQQVLSTKSNMFLVMETITYSVLYMARFSFLLLETYFFYQMMCCFLLLKTYCCYYTGYLLFSLTGYLLLLFYGVCDSFHH